MRRRVVITGMGPVSNIGTGLAEFSESLRAGKIGTGPIKSFDTTGYVQTMGGEISGFDPSAILRHVDPADGRFGRTALLSAAAARLAADDAGLDLRGSRTAVIMSTTSGEIPALVDMTREWHLKGLGAPDPQAAATVSAAQLSLAAARELGTVGEVGTIGSACAASNYAIGYAYDLIGMGQADTAVAGGADSVNRFTHSGFHRLGALADDVCRPFDEHRDGLIAAEGGVALVLEELERAEARGARIYAEVLGYGMNDDASDPATPDAEGIARCFRIAHRRAGVTPDQIDYVCAHGTATKANDLAEAKALRAVFGERTPPVSSIKSMMGHTMGAASGFGAIACALSVSEGFIPPTVNHRGTDPALPGLDVVANRIREADVRIAQNNGYAFGGNNAVVMFGRAR